MTFTELFEASMIALACIMVALSVAAILRGMEEG